MRHFWLILLLAVSLPAWAHPLNDAYAEFRVEGQAVTVDWKVPRSMLATADRDGDGEVSPGELSSQDLAALLEGHFELFSNQSKGSPSDPHWLETSPSHYRLEFKVHFDQPIEGLRIYYDLFPPDDPTGRTLAVLHNGDFSTSLLFTRERPETVITLEAPRQSFRDFVGLGVVHILTGYDHILFLLCLLLAGGRLWNLIKVVTAFTLAHSLSLALAVFDIVHLPSQLIECAIALSIVLAAALNFWPQLETDEHDRRPLVAGSFGLLHGLGFASVLQEMHLHGWGAAMPLVSFNLGVELGQLIITLIAFPVILWVQKTEWKTTFVRVGSVAVGWAGFYWFCQRLVG
ncbi:MAG: HupE/UreJ family protein [Candidatus Eremiobacteraeota bacterium]|nr:HupE/UreJ family protein [Candidatus Eremiobacteraeota bacterium]